MTEVVQDRATDLSAALATAYAAVGTALDLLECPGVDDLSVDELLTAIDAGRRVVNRIAAAQTLAVVGVVARERVEQEARRTHPSPGLRSSADPKVRESDARAGAAALVAGPLGIAEGWARDRVEHATRLCGAARSVLTAQRAGDLDPYRVGIVLNEISDAREDVAKQVADRLVPELVAALVENPSGDTGGRLRNRVRTVIADVDADADADAVRQRAVRARQDRCLRRWVAEPGVDGWEGTFKAEDAATARAVIDTLARQYVTERRNTTLGQARADALLDLVHARATVTPTVALTLPAIFPDNPQSPAKPPASPETPTPADTSDPGDQPETVEPNTEVAGQAQRVIARLNDAAADAGQPSDSLVAVSGFGPTPILVPTSWIANLLDSAVTTKRVRVQGCHPDTGAWIDPHDDLDTPTYRPSARLIAFVKGRDGGCPIPRLHHPRPARRPRPRHPPP